MSYRKKMSKGKSKKSFRRGDQQKKINHVGHKMGSRGGIRL